MGMRVKTVMIVKTTRKSRIVDYILAIIFNLLSTQVLSNNFISIQTLFDYNYKNTLQQPTNFSPYLKPAQFIRKTFANTVSISIYVREAPLTVAMETLELAKGWIIFKGPFFEFIMTSQVSKVPSTNVMTDKSSKSSP